MCPQGVTGLTLSVEPVGPLEVVATFSFYGVPENPTVPAGRYLLRGILHSGTGVVSLAPDRWLEQPRGYVMVGMTGLFDLEAGVMQGRIDNERCGPFDLRRTR